MSNKYIILGCFFKLINNARKDKPKGYQFKIKNYNKAINLLKKANDTWDKYEDFEDLMLEGFKNPKKILAKIQEIINTGTLESLKDYEEDPMIKTINELTGVHGIGTENAKKLYKLGIKTIEELRDNPQYLNDVQKIGLKYYDDIKKRIPREEIDVYDKIFQWIYKKYKCKIKINIAGSYRRGVKNSGDIDLLVSSDKYQGKVIPIICNELKKLKLLKAVLASGTKKFMGIIRMKGKPSRRLDICETTSEEYPFALLYFTGSKEHNVKMRKEALKYGLSLNEKDITRVNTGEKISNDLIIKKIGKYKIETEKDIFKFLDMTYKLPKHRF